MFLDLSQHELWGSIQSCPDALPRQNFITATPEELAQRDRNIAFGIFVAGNVILWGTGILGIHSGLEQFLGASFAPFVLHDWLRGQKHPWLNIRGNCLATVAMGLLNGKGLYNMDPLTIAGFLGFTGCRGFAIYNTLSISKQFDNAKNFLTRTVSKNRQNIMLGLGIGSRSLMLAGSLMMHRPVMALVQATWIGAEYILGRKPQRTLPTATKAGAVLVNN